MVLDALEERLAYLTKELEFIKDLEKELLGLVINGHLPSQVEQQIEQACLTLMKARSLLQFTIESSSEAPNYDEALCI